MSHKRDPLRSLHRTRGAGQSALSRLFQQSFTRLAYPFTLLMIAIGGFCASLASMLPAHSPAWQLGLQSLILLIGIVWFTIAWRKTMRDMHTYGLGHRGERAVATLLAEFGKDGYTLINDIEAKDAKANIDHVLIGPPGIFVIETKTLTKPATLKPGERPLITAKDGKLLRHGLPMDRDPIAQVRACADQLRRMLSPLPDASNIPIHMVVAFPGWWVDSSAKHVNGVHVINPKQIYALTEDMRGTGRPEDISRVYKFLAQEIARDLDAQPDT